MIVERGIMQYQMAWEHFVRSFILCSATGKFSDKNGLVVSNLPTPPRNVHEASRCLVSMYPKSGQEPDWYLSTRAIDAAAKLKLSNYNTISAVLGMTPWPIDELRHIRNFAAHRSKSSALKLRDQNIVRQRPHIDVCRLIFEYDSSGQQRFQTYASFIKLAGRQLLG